MSAVIDMTGLRFGRLAVIARAPKFGGQAFWECVCDCSKFSIVRGADLRNGHTTSCGCVPVERIQKIGKTTNRKHGLSGTSAYANWRHMVARCANRDHPAYKDYGARGIDVCSRWLDFETFYREFGVLRPSSKHSIDRIDNDKGYAPGNVRWALPEVQQNNRRDTKRIAFAGLVLSQSQWAKKIGLSGSALASRLKSGWPIAAALTEPANPNRRFQSAALQ